MGRRGLAALAIWVCAGPTLAAGVLPINGVFGNDAGCRQFMAGLQGDDVLLLTEHTFTRGRTGCYFETLISREGTGFAVEMLCSVPNAPGERETLVVVHAEGTAGYLASLGDTLYGPMLPCPGTEHLFPRGVQV